MVGFGGERSREIGGASAGRKNSADPAFSGYNTAGGIFRISGCADWPSIFLAPCSGLFCVGPHTWLGFNVITLVCRIEKLV